MELVVPDRAHLPGFVAALERGWSPSSESDVSGALLAAIAANPADVLAELDDRDPVGRTVELPDGSKVPRLPGLTRWMWDEEGFAGSINARWSPGTAALPPYVLGHVGYSVVEWRRRRGHATQALRQLLPELRAVGLPYVELTTDPGNEPSQKVVTANGGVLVDDRDKGAAYHGDRVLVFRIDLA
jgi:predicted acetyltransferase